MITSSGSGIVASRGRLGFSGRGRCMGADGRRRKGRSMCCGPCPTLITSLLAATNSDSGDESSPDDCNSGHGSDSGNGRRGSYKGNSRLRNKIHGDMHASDACGGRQQHSLVLAVARYGLAPCPRTRHTFVFGLMKRYRRRPE